MATVLAMLLALPATVRAGRADIQSEPVTCVLVDRYARVFARGVPPDEVGTAALEFRADAAAPWYAVRMAAEGDGWAGFLPRPRPGLERFWYRIVMGRPGQAPSSTAPVAVRVVSDPSACPREGGSALSAPIVVRVPAGVPVIPPVPAGFSPTGVVSDQELGHPDSRKTLKIVAGVGLAGGLTAVALVGSKGGTTPPPPDIPDFLFDATQPAPGGVLHVGSRELIVFVRMSREPSQPLTFNWRFEMQSAAGPQVCVVMSDVFPGAQSPPNLSLVAPLASTGLCGERFDVLACHLTIQVETRRVLDLIIDLPFRFEP
jgi:hypothetical protein